MNLVAIDFEIATSSRDSVCALAMVVNFSLTTHNLHPKSTRAVRRKL